MKFQLHMQWKFHTVSARARVKCIFDFMFYTYTVIAVKCGLNLCLNVPLSKVEDINVAGTKDILQVLANHKLISNKLCRLAVDSGGVRKGR